jgi:hypothetical protein
MTTTTDTLSPQDVLNLSKIIDAAYGSKKVARADDNGAVIYGIARHLVSNPETYVLSSSADVRDCWLRVTTRSGSEVVWPIRELAREISTGEFAQYDWSN